MVDFWFRETSLAASQAQLSPLTGHTTGPQNTQCVSQMANKNLSEGTWFEESSAEAAECRRKNEDAKGCLIDILGVQCDF